MIIVCQKCRTRFHLEDDATDRPSFVVRCTVCDHLFSAYKPNRVQEITFLDLEQARRLARLLRGKPLKVNLIPLNRLDDADLAPPPEPQIQAFRRVLADAGILTFVRTSGGRDIAAACGQLRRRRQVS